MHGIRKKDGFKFIQTGRQCGGALSHVGSVNTLDMFECIECGTRYSVRRRYKLDANNHAVFDGYDEPVRC